MMTNIITLNIIKENALIKCKTIRDVLQNIHQGTCITSRCVFFSILFLCKNDDIVRGEGEGVGKL